MNNADCTKFNLDIHAIKINYIFYCIAQLGIIFEKNKIKYNKNKNQRFKPGIFCLYYFDKNLYLSLKLKFLITIIF